MRLETIVDVSGKWPQKLFILCSISIRVVLGVAVETRQFTMSTDCVHAECEKLDKSRILWLAPSNYSANNSRDNHNNESTVWYVPYSTILSLTLVRVYNHLYFYLSLRGLRWLKYTSTPGLIQAYLQVSYQ